MGGSVITVNFLFSFIYKLFRTLLNNLIYVFFREFGHLVPWLPLSRLLLPWLPLVEIPLARLPYIRLTFTRLTSTAVGLLVLVAVGWPSSRF